MKKKIFAVFLLLIILLSNFACSKADEKITCYEANLTFDDQAMTLKGNVLVDYVNDCDEPLSKICFHLYANSYAQNSKNPAIAEHNFNVAYPNGEYSFGNISILDVKSGEQSLQFEINENGNILTIPLDKQLFPDENIKVDILFEIVLANVHHRLGYGTNAINFGNFLPIACLCKDGEFDTRGYSTNGDPFFSACANYRLKVVVPNDYVASFGGKVVKKSADNDVTTYEISANNIREFAMVFSKYFKILSTTVGDTTLEYYYYDDENAEESLNIAKQSLEYFSNSFGTYPYPTMSVVQTNFFVGGMEYPSLVLISDLLTEDVMQETIVHEIAHQWWYGIVGNNQLDYAFVDEGLAELSTMLFFGNHKEYNIKQSYFVDRAENSYSIFCQTIKNVTGNLNTTMQRNLEEFGSEYEYVTLCYSKSLLMFDQVKKTIGEKKLLKGLAKYYAKNKFKIGSLADLQHCLSQGVDIAPLMNSFIQGKV